MKKIKNELKKIEQIEANLLEREGEVLEAEQLVLSKEKEIEREVRALQNETVWVKQIESRRRMLVKRLSKHKFIFSMLVTFGVVLIWRGMWGLSDLLPIVKETGVSLLLGFGILWFLEKYSEG